MDIQASLQDRAINSLDIYLEVKLLDHITVFLIFPIVAATILHSHQYNFKSP